MLKVYSMCVYDFDRVQRLPVTLKETRVWLGQIILWNQFRNNNYHNYHFFELWFEFLTDINYCTCEQFFNSESVESYDFNGRKSYCDHFHWLSYTNLKYRFWLNWWWQLNKYYSEKKTSEKKMIRNIKGTTNRMIEQFMLLKGEWNLRSEI